MHLDDRAELGDPLRGRAQARQAPHEPARQQHADRQRRQQPDHRGDDQRVPHDHHGGVGLIEALAHGDGHQAPVRPHRRGDPRDRLPAGHGDVGDRVVLAQGGGRLGEALAAVGVGGRHAVPVGREDRDLAARPPAQAARRALEVARGGVGAQHVGDAGSRGERRVVQAGDRVVAQAPVERAEQRHAGHDERQHVRHDQRRDDPRAQAAQPEHR